MKKKMLFYALIYLLFMSFSLDCNLAEAKSKVALSKNEITLKKGEVYKLKLSSAKSKKVKWNSTNEKIASVKNGNVKAKKEGMCYIVAKYKKNKYKCKVMVKNSSTDMGISLVVNNFNEDTGTISYSITNVSEQEIAIPTFFILERLEDGQWAAVPPKTNEVTADAMLLMPGTTTTIEANLFVVYGLLENGIYRIAIPAIETVYSSEFPLYCIKS